MDILEDKIISRFWVVTKITTNNAQVFSSDDSFTFCFNYGNVLSHSSHYYRQQNCLDESRNKNLMNIIKKIVQENLGQRN